LTVNNEQNGNKNSHLSLTTDAFKNFIK